MSRFIVDTERVVGQRGGNFVVKDTATQTVLFRSASKQTAEETANKANLALAGSE